MTQPASNPDALADFRARNTLIHQVRDQLKGTGLDIRELAKELAVSNPGHPEKGRLYINCATGEVSHRLPVLGYLGYLNGYGGDRDPDEPRVDADKIVSTLTGAGYTAILVPPSDLP
jgi:hypothetical protein